MLTIKIVFFFPLNRSMLIQFPPMATALALWLIRILTASARRLPAILRSRKPARLVIFLASGAPSPVASTARNTSTSTSAPAPRILPTLEVFLSPSTSIIRRALRAPTSRCPRDRPLPALLQLTVQSPLDQPSPHRVRAVLLRLVLRR